MDRLPDPARSRAVLIGASRYTDRELADLPAVHANLTDLHAVLTSDRGTGLPRRHCLVERDPTDGAAIGERLAIAAREAEDLLLIYYAGHGLTWTNRNELYLALGNTRSSTVGTSALRCADVRQVFLDSAARTRVLILDCCLSGRAVEQTMAGSAPALLDQVDVHGAYVLTATEPNQLAKAPPGERNTLFTGELLRLLRAGIPGGPELLTLDVLYRSLRASLGRRNLPQPTCNNSDAAAHLALAPNAARRSAQRGIIGVLHEKIAELEAVARAYPERRAAVSAARDELAAAEVETEQIYGTVLDKIAAPGLLPPVTHAPGLAGRLARLDRLAADEDWARLADELDALDREIAEARDGTARLHATARGLLDRREELRGRVTVLLAMAVRLGVAEKEDVASRHELARDLLWTKPCDLRAATRAVLAFQRSVTDGRE
jgi:Caspase domain